MNRNEYHNHSLFVVIEIIVNTYLFSYYVSIVKETIIIKPKRIVLVTIDQYVKFHQLTHQDVSMSYIE